MTNPLFFTKDIKTINRAGLLVKDWNDYWNSERTSEALICIDRSNCCR